MIREAEEKDIPQILFMAERFWLETVYEEEFEADHTQKTLDLAMHQGLVAVLEIDGVLEGFVAGVMACLMASSKALVGIEVAWWVNPEHRKGRRGIELMLYIEQLAKTKGIKYWGMVSMESSSPEASSKIYSRLGYNKTETSFMKVI